MIELEIFDIVNEAGEPTGETVERSEAHLKGIRHRTSHVWLLRRSGDIVEVLVQKRSEDKDSFPGCYDISSAGHIPAGDDFIGSALRELSEELGLELSAGQLHFCGSKSVFTEAEFYGKPFRDNQFTRVYAVWYEPSMGDFRLQKEEISEVRWLKLSECIRLVGLGDPRFCIDPDELQMLRRFAGEETAANV